MTSVKLKMMDRYRFTDISIIYIERSVSNKILADNLLKVFVTKKKKKCIDYNIVTFRCYNYCSL